MFVSVVSLLDKCNSIRARGQRERGGAHHQGTRKIWVPKLDHKVDERTAKSEGKDQRKKGQKHTGKSKDKDKGKDKLDLSQQQKNIDKLH